MESTVEFVDSQFDGLQWVGRVNIQNDGRYSLYEKLHFWEIDLRDRINSRLPILLAIILALFGVESYLINELRSMQSSPIELVVTALLFLSVTCLFISIYHTVRSWHGLEYALLPSAQRLDDQAQELREYCASLPDCDDIDECLATEIRIDLFRLYVRCGSRNHELNIVKSFRLHCAFNWILGSLGFALVTYILLTFVHSTYDLPV